MMYVPKMSRDIQQGIYFQVVDVPLSAPIFENISFCDIPILNLIV